MINLSEFVDAVDKIAQPYFAKLLEEYKLSAFFIAELEGPNIVFRNSTVQYVVNIMKFKDTKKKYYKDLLGASRILFIISRNNLQDTESKIQKSFDIAYKICDANIMHPEGETALMLYE